MPVSKKGRTKKNNSFGLRKKEKAKKELREWQERKRANRDYDSVSMAEILEPADEPNGYAIEDTPSPIKENKMKGKVGDRVVEFYKPHEVLSKTKPLQKITRKELAKMGYELVD